MQFAICKFHTLRISNEFGVSEILLDIISIFLWENDIPVPQALATGTVKPHFQHFDK